MKDPLLLVLVALVGVFLYFVAAKGVVYLFMFPLMAVAVALWYFCNFWLSDKMIRKARGEEDFFFIKAQMIDERKNELVNGALVVTPNEVVFCKRKGYKGGISIIWSCFTSQIESYSLDVIDEHHKGLLLNLKKEKKPVRFACPKLKEQENAFRKGLGWDAE